MLLYQTKTKKEIVATFQKKPNQAPDFSHSFMHTKVGAWRRYKSEIIYYNPSTSYAASTSF